MVPRRERPPALATSITAGLRASITPRTAHTFANGESFDTSVRGSDAFVLHTATEPLNTALLEQLIMIDALKRASVKRITVSWPFYCHCSRSTFRIQRGDCSRSTTGLRH